MKAYAIAITLLLVIFGAIGAYLYQRFSAFASMDFSPPPVTVAVSTARTETWAETLSAVGSIRAVRGVELTSESSGEIVAIRFASGDRVEAGQALVVLERQSIPQTQFDRSRADLERARAQLAETQARLDNKRIEAPFAGTIGISRLDVGDYLSPGTVIATLQDLSELEIDFTVPARFVPALRPELPITVQVDAYPGRDFPALVTAVDPRIDPETRNILLRAKLERTDGLLPGMFASLALDLGERQELVTVPETAVTYALQGNLIYVVEPLEDGALTASARVVRVGKVRDGRVAVLDGVAAGERVVSVGQNKLYRGVRVVIDERVAL
jgi:membrane fusion protein (multidrug efflux system)